MSKWLMFFLILGILLVLAGCNPAPAIAPATDAITETAVIEISTPSPLPELVTTTQTPELSVPPDVVYSIDTLTPSLTPNPAVRPSRTPKPTPTPKPLRAAIEILYPGPDSKVVSEVELRANVRPGKDGRIHTELIGEDGRIIFEQAPRYEIGSNVWGYIVVRIPFTSPFAGELCRLQVVTRDEYGRTLAVNAVHLLILTGGYPEINPPDRADGRIQVTRPKGADEIVGNLMIVEGRIRPVNDQPLIIELMDETGNILASRKLPIPASQTGDYIPFAVDLSYTITKFVKARLTLYQEDNRIPGIMYLYSQEVFLKP